MNVQIRKRQPAMAEALPYTAIIATRDGRGVLVGARVVRARTEGELDRKLAETTSGSAEAEPLVDTEGIKNGIHD